MMYNYYTQLDIFNNKIKFLFKAILLTIYVYEISQIQI